MPTIITRGAGSALALISSQPTSYTFDDATYATGFDNPVQTVNINLYNFFTPSQLFTGRQFTMTGKSLAGWQSPTLITSTFTFGTAGSATSPRTYRKMFFVQNVYDGNQTIYVYGYYSGDSTSSPRGTVTLSALSLVI